MTKLKDKPFALIGINTAGDDVARLKQVMDKENLPWPSFADPGAVGEGPITTRWNMSATPTMYLLDHHGIIRHKWVGAPGEKLLDRSIEKLLEGASDERRSPRR